jgi:myosin heavy subunit
MQVRSDPSAVQSILVVGESGSGKTVAFESLLSHAPAAPRSGFHEWFKHAQALLTAFGCAAVPRNPASTRFVSILRLGLGPDGAITSAQVSTPHSTTHSTPVVGPHTGRHSH